MVKKKITKKLKRIKNNGGRMPSSKSKASKIKKIIKYTKNKPKKKKSFVFKSLFK